MTLRVMVVSNSPGSLSGFRLSVMKEMVARGCEVVAVAPGLDQDEAAMATLAGANIGVAAVPMSRTGMGPLAELRTIAALYRLMRSMRPDRLLCCTVKPVTYGLIAGAIARVPRRVALITGLGYAFISLGGGLKRRIVRGAVEGLYKVAFRRADTVVFQNPDDAALFGRLGLLSSGVPVEVVAGSGVDLEEYPAAELPGGDFRFLMVGRLLKAKGVREYAEAATLLKREFPDARFDLIGPLDENPDAVSAEVAAAWSEAGVPTWHGPRRDIAAQLAASHVFVLPSYREGVPRSTLEAMATGRAIITTDAPGCRETVVEGGNGMRVPVGDHLALASAMRSMLCDPALARRMGERSREIAEERFDVEKVNARMCEIMQIPDSTRHRDAADRKNAIGAPL